MAGRFKFFLICACVVTAFNLTSKFGFAQSRTEDVDPGVTRVVREALERYEAQLNAVLKTRREEEKQFVADVVELIAQEKIPKKLVDSSWLWVRSKRPYTNYPFIYFERVLRLQAEKAGVTTIPQFDRNIYSQLFRQSFRQSFRQPGTLPR